MRSHEALSSAVWSEVEKRSFDNAVARAPECSALSREARARWLATGSRTETRSGNIEDVGNARHIFMVRGKARLRDAELDADSPATRLSQCSTGDEVVAVDDCRYILLPPPGLLEEGDAAPAEPE